MDYYFVFDVESVGLFGPPFGYAYVIVDSDGKEHANGIQWANIEAALTNMEPRYRVNAGDIWWVVDNVTIHYQGKRRVCTRDELIQRFWVAWTDATINYDGIRLVADCQFPVESNFLLEVAAHQGLTLNDSPYPVLDVNSAMLVAGRPPLATYTRLDNELPAHDPLADARQSARLFIECLRETKALREMATA